MADTHEGRLELTWTNKDKRLLSYEDGSYVWVPPSDHRVAEVRLLDDGGTVVGVAGNADRAADNLLIRGDALNALTSLTQLPEFAKEYAGKVKLAYLDPPFNTQQSFLHYDDALEHSVWLTMMRDRLVQVKKLLAPEGSVWVHCDDSEQHRLRVMMDEVLGPGCFVATVVWQKRTSRENRKAIGMAHDYLHVYTPLGRELWREVRNRLTRRTGGASNPDSDSRGPWDSVPFTAQGYRENQMYEIETPSGVVHRPPKGRCWGATRPEFERLRADNRIYFPRSGMGRPRVKQFVSEAQGLVPMSWWAAHEVGTNDEAKKAIMQMFPEVDAFDTPKPERLMQRIIAIATNPGDIVLDPFLGSGTTAAVAHKMGRRWVGIERSQETVDTFAAPRLTKVIEGQDPGGIRKAAGWSGSGGFRVLDVAPSMFDAAEGSVVIADWASNGLLSEVTAAQLGFEFDPDAPFAGRKGRSRLAVIDGLVNPNVAEVLVDALPDGEVLTLCGSAVDEATGPALRKLRRGSVVRKIPASILADYRRQRGPGEQRSTNAAAAAVPEASGS